MVSLTLHLHEHSCYIKAKEKASTITLALETAALEAVSHKVGSLFIGIHSGNVNIPVYGLKGIVWMN